MCSSRRAGAFEDWPLFAARAPGPKMTPGFFTIHQWIMVLPPKVFGTIPLVSLLKLLPELETELRSVPNMRLIQYCWWNCNTPVRWATPAGPSQPLAVGSCVRQKLDWNWHPRRVRLGSWGCIYNYISLHALPAGIRTYRWYHPQGEALIDIWSHLLSTRPATPLSSQHVLMCIYYY